jgi:hypothetical protein
MALDSTEYLIHTLNVALDDLRDRMRWEAARNEPDNHYHYVVNYKCNKDNCAGVDPVLAVYVILQDQVDIIEDEFSGHILSARHIP